MDGKDLSTTPGNNPEVLDRSSITTYTKHYYIGSERIASTLGTMKNLGVLCEWNFPGDSDLVTEMDGKTQQAQDVLLNDYATLEKEIQLPAPFLYEGSYLPYCSRKTHNDKNYDAYWYHPDHLGSSNYITNLDGIINQHMEYLPFGETLVEEHLNSYNSPYKFNAKELDAETGWYYYGARYYNPKWSIWLSVDPLADDPEQVDKSPYAFAWNNPIRYIDPTGLKPLDDYGLDKEGNIELLRKTDDATDKLIALDDNGNETDKSIEVEKGILNNIERTTVKDSDGVTRDVQIMEVTNSENAMGLFEFIAGNSNNEVSYSSWFSNRQFVSTSFQEYAENSINVLYPRHNYLLHHIHSHPDPYLAPSPGDIGTSGIFRKRLGYKPLFQIYSPFLRKYKSYDENSVSFELDEVIIGPKN